MSSYGSMPFRKRTIPYGVVPGSPAKRVKVLRQTSKSFITGPLTKIYISCYAILVRGLVIKLFLKSTKITLYEIGHSTMLNSNSSIHPSIKTKHRTAKSKTNRRRRIDFPYGCALYTTIECIINYVTEIIDAR